MLLETLLMHIRNLKHIRNQSMYFVIESNLYNLFGSQQNSLTLWLLYLFSFFIDSIIGPRYWFESRCERLQPEQEKEEDINRNVQHQEGQSYKQLLLRSP